MGTPEFAVASLGALMMNNFEVAGIVTTPDKPAGRGQKVNWSTVKGYARNTGIPILQPANLQDADFIEALKSFKADLFVVVAFRKLPKVVWEIPPLGTLNLHASLLPQYRGAAPINHVLMQGEETTGVTTFLINDQIDTGNILLQTEVHINPEENAGELHDRLMREGAKLLVRTVEELWEGKLTARRQEELMPERDALKTAPKIHPEDCYINWNTSCQNVFNFIRALSPRPGARTLLQTRREEEPLLLKIFESDFQLEQHQETVGSIHSDGKQYLRIAVADGMIDLKKVQIQGRKKMDIGDFLRGFDTASMQIR
jgi:methionyl-tRNA formyltransferase